ncbi:hypothetical protein JG688_00014477 [Phytophthora aleatoria]|uniref:Uncharacterized protein n=1 Tax=Phytophthora aleatoria TaxID=2496075 RepID=A0A8J5IVD1_9STRA|nr:hypothetical protein JG688_00014477 [Phytophthora aleatoria]
MVQWFLDHFQGFEIPSEVVAEAAKNGHLSVVKFLWEHDQGHAYPHECSSDAGGLERSRALCELGRPRNSGSAEKRTPRCRQVVNNICEVAVNVGNFDLARLLLPLDKSIAEYVCHWAKVEVVEPLLESTDILKKHQDFAAFVNSKIAYKGNLGLI